MILSLPENEIGDNGAQHLAEALKVNEINFLLFNQER